MVLRRILALVVLAVGIVLLVYGIDSTDSMAEKIVEGTTGRYTDETMWYIIGGIAMIIAGGAYFVSCCCRKC
jgi:uncharacterized membrane protein YidH (DUF202 family)